MSERYNPLKLSVYRPLFGGQKVLIIGAGAVGSNVAENVAKMGSSLDVLDFDTFSLENAAKHSCLVRTPDDVGRNKAECVSARVQSILDEGCSSNGIDADLCMIGPEAIAEYDAVILCVDNYAAKALFNQLWKQIPEERRPIVIMDGTYEEMAQSTMADGRDFCLRCTIDESWMKTAAVRTSCGSPQHRDIDGVPEIIRTSGVASSVAANLSCEQYRAWVIGDKRAMNRRLTYVAYPNLSLDSTWPMKKRSCPDCGIIPPANLKWLPGTVLSVTLDDALALIADALGTEDFEIEAHTLNYKNILYSGFILEDVCHVCGKPIPVMKHEGRTFLKDLICEDCHQAGKTPYYSADFASGKVLHAFDARCSEAVRGKTLFELGYPLGAHIQVVQRNGALDVLDKNFIRTTFAFREDPQQMHFVKKL